MDGHLLRFNKKASFCFVDIETFNLCLNLKFNCAWQVAIINVVGDTVKDEHDILIKWENPSHIEIKPEVAAMNHYNKEKVDRLGISPEQAIKQIDKHLRACDYIVAHNGLGFDLYILRSFYKKFGMDWRFIPSKLIDTRAIAQGIKTNNPFTHGSNLLTYQYCMINKRVKGIKTSLSFLAKEEGIDFDPTQLHDALYDLRVNVQLWNKLKHKVEL